MIGGLPAIREGVEAGVEWRVLLAPLGSFMNGYARIPTPHPWARLVLTEEVPVDVHGGVTYLADQWVGFDTGHYRDVWTEEALAPAGGRLTGYEGVSDGDPFNRFWTLDAVEGEARELARQIAAALTTSTTGETPARKEHA